MIMELESYSGKNKLFDCIFHTLLFTRFITDPWYFPCTSMLKIGDFNAL